MKDQGRKITVKTPPQQDSAPLEEDDAGAFTVNDRRHWADGVEDADGVENDSNEKEQEPAPEGKDRDAIIRQLLEKLESTEQEFENFKKRLEKDLEKQVENRIKSMFPMLLESIDSLDRSLETGAQSDVKTLVTGMELLRQQLLKALGEIGITRIEPMGEEFDPALHEAISTMPVEDKGLNGKVVSVIRPAYVSGEKLIRPAQVIVGKSK